MVWVACLESQAIHLSESAWKVLVFPHFQTKLNRRVIIGWSDKRDQHTSNNLEGQVAPAIWHFNIYHSGTWPIARKIWLVVDLPLWKIWKSVGMIIPNIWKNKIHVPNHQQEIYLSLKVPGWFSSSQTSTGGYWFAAARLIRRESTWPVMRLLSIWQGVGVNVQRVAVPKSCSASGTLSQGRSDKNGAPDKFSQEPLSMIKEWVSG